MMEKPDAPLEDAPEIKAKPGHDVDALARRIRALEFQVADLVRALDALRQNIVSS